MKKGSKHTEETKQKISINRKLKKTIPHTAFKKGFAPWNKGKKCPHISERNRVLNQLQSGNKHWNWKGGISRIEKRVRRMPEYIQWRDEVFKRDIYTCKNCGYNKYVTAHHIKAFALILMENNIKTLKDARLCNELWELSNGITLCEDCHSKTDNYKKRIK